MTRLRTLWRWLRTTGYDFELSGYLAILLGAAALFVTLSVAGPTLDAQSAPYPTCTDCGKTAVAAKE